MGFFFNVARFFNLGFFSALTRLLVMGFFFKVARLKSMGFFSLLTK